MVWEFTSTRVWRRNYVRIRMEVEKEHCTKEATKEGGFNPQVFRECIERAREKVREEARMLKWYETKLNFISQRTVRIFDYSRGMYIICWLAPRRERPRARPAVVCMHWDPATFRFAGAVHSIHPCRTSIFDACYRADATRNLHLEAESCGIVVVRGLGYRLRLRGIRDLAELLVDASTDANAGVDECLDLFDLAGDPRVEDYYGYSSTYNDVCFYCRCKEAPGEPRKLYNCRECDKARELCRPTEFTPEVLVYE